MVKRGLDADLGIMQRGGVDGHLGVTRATAEQIHGTALANHLQRPLPRGRLPDGLDYSIGAAPALGQLAHEAHRIVDLGDVVGRDGAQAFRGAHLTVALADGDYPHVTTGKYADEFQTNGTAADDHNGVAVMNSGFMHSPEHTGQWLDDGCVQKRDRVGNLKHVLADNAARDADVFSVCAVVEQQIFTEIGLALAAEEALIAGSGIGRYHAHALAHDAIDRAALLLDRTGKLVPKQRRRLNHALVKALLPDLQIGAAGERNFHANQHVIGTQPRNIHALDLDVLRPVENGCGHVPVFF